MPLTPLRRRELNLLERLEALTLTAERARSVIEVIFPDITAISQTILTQLLG
jgi:hypothetical protein